MGQYGGGRGQKWPKIGNVVYGWPLKGHTKMHIIVCKARFFVNRSDSTGQKGVIFSILKIRGVHNCKKIVCYISFLGSVYRPYKLIFIVVEKLG